MNVFAISDLHLPARQKPMDIFGPHWAHHFERIAEDWKARVAEEDIVLLPGDLSWAMHLEEALEDLERVAALPGRKILLRGNHDYWWNAIGRVRRALPEGMYAIQNDALLLEGIVFAGTRGWTLPSQTEQDDPDTMKIYLRERQRLNMSLNEARRIAPDLTPVVMLHYPPCTYANGGFSDILRDFGIRHCVYGHLHGAGLRGAVNGLYGGIWYHQVSCDGLDFKLHRLEMQTDGEEVQEEE